VAYWGRLPDAKSLGQMLAQARAIRGWSQRDLARRLSVSQRYIWEMESGEPTTAIKRLFAAMAATGMTLTAEIEAGPDDNPDPSSVRRPGNV
jgi:transcriptional regulator with XRE-family HTH domain